MLGLSHCTYVHWNTHLSPWSWCWKWAGLLEKFGASRSHSTKSTYFWLARANSNYLGVYKICLILKSKYDHIRNFSVLWQVVHSATNKYVSCLPRHNSACQPLVNGKATSRFLFCTLFAGTMVSSLWRKEKKIWVCAVVRASWLVGGPGILAQNFRDNTSWRPTPELQSLHSLF